MLEFSRDIIIVLRVAQICLISSQCEAEVALTAAVCHVEWNRELDMFESK